MVGIQISPWLFLYCWRQLLLPKVNHMLVRYLFTRRSWSRRPGPFRGL